MTEEQKQTQESQVEETREEQTTTESADGPKKLELTQEELDELIAKRVARERKKLEKYKDYDDIKAKLAEYEAEAEERRKAELTEVERLKEELEAAQKVKEELESKYNALSESLKQSKIEARFRELAQEHNIEHLEAAKKLADLSQITVDDDGVHGLEDVIKKLVEENPFLVAKKEPETIGEETNPSKQATAKSKQQMLKEAEEKARSGNPADIARWMILKKELGM
jgi:hypothetical protein